MTIKRNATLCLLSVYSFMKHPVFFAGLALYLYMELKLHVCEMIKRNLFLKNIHLLGAAAAATTTSSDAIHLKNVPLTRVSRFLLVITYQLCSSILLTRKTKR